MKLFKLLLVLLTVLGFVYYQIDSYLFYYGRNDLPIYHRLPFNVIPEYRPAFEGGFVLRDQDQVGFVYKGIGYAMDHREVVIQDILAYGFNAKEIVAIVTDSTGMKYYLKVSPMPASGSSMEVTVNSFEKIDSASFTKWVTIEGKQGDIQRIWVLRNDILFILMAIIPVIVVYAVKGTRRSNKKEGEL